MATVNSLDWGAFRTGRALRGETQEESARAFIDLVRKTDASFGTRELMALDDAWRRTDNSVAWEYFAPAQIGAPLRGNERLIEALDRARPAPLIPKSDRPSVSFTSSQLPYECTIHSFRMTDKDHPEKSYFVTLDLIRSNKTKDNWGISEDRRGLRATVYDADTKQLVASKLVEMEKSEFEAKVGEMEPMNGFNNIRFEANVMSPGDHFNFEFHVDLREPHPAGKLTNFLNRAANRLPGLGVALELNVTEYDHSFHNGYLNIIKNDGDPLTLEAINAPSSVSQHFGQKLPPYAYVQSFSEDGSGVIAVSARPKIDVLPSVDWDDRRLPISYVCLKDKSGKTDVKPIGNDMSRLPDGTYLIGDHELGIQVRPGTDLNRVQLTGIDSVMGMSEIRVVKKLGDQKDEEVLVDWRPALLDLTGELRERFGRV